MKLELPLGEISYSIPVLGFEKKKPPTPVGQGESKPSYRYVGAPLSNASPREGVYSFS